MTTGNLTWEQAARRVLEEAEEPMHYRDVADIIVQQNLTRSVGATPPSQANSALRSLVRAGEVVESAGVGTYALPAIDKRTAEEDAKFKGIASYGLYWEKGRVNWTPGQRGRGVRGIKLLGRAKGEDEAVNFASQQGIYLLHQGMDVLYVGQTSYTNNGLFLRLRSHRDDLTKAPLWERFSWFGFRPVRNRELAPMDDELAISPRVLIKVVETVLIQSCLPRLNGQSGELLGTIYEQVDDPDLLTN